MCLNSKTNISFHERRISFSAPNGVPLLVDLHSTRERIRRASRYRSSNDRTRLWSLTMKIETRQYENRIEKKNEHRQNCPCRDTKVHATIAGLFVVPEKGEQLAKRGSRRGTTISSFFFLNFFFCFSSFLISLNHLVTIFSSYTIYDTDGRNGSTRITLGWELFSRSFFFVKYLCHLLSESVLLANAPYQKHTFLATLFPQFVLICSKRGLPIRTGYFQIRLSILLARQEAGQTYASLLLSKIQLDGDLFIFLAPLTPVCFSCKTAPREVCGISRLLKTDSSISVGESVFA